DENRRLKTQLAAANARIAELEQQLAQAQGVIATQKRTIDELKQTIREQDRNIGALQNQKTSLQQRVAELTEQLAREQGKNEALETEIRSLKAQIDALSQQLSAAESQVALLRAQLRAAQEDLGQAREVIDTLQQEQKHLQGLYATKIEELNAAMSTIRNLEKTGQEHRDLIADYRILETELRQDLEGTRQQYAEASAKVTELLDQLTTERERYETLRTTCPIIPNGSTVVDGTDGTMYFVEQGALRPMSEEVWRSRGSPEFTAYPGYQLINCSRGPPMEVVTTTPAPVTEPGIEYDGNVYVLVHAGAWMNDGTLNVAATRFGGLMLEPFKFRDSAQAWAIAKDGHIRSLSGPGMFLNSVDTCLSPTLTSEQGDSWTLQPSATSDNMRYALRAGCGNVLRASTDDRGITLGGRDAEEAEWFVVPVGRLTV
ncbi:MAG: hypothetical protein ACO37D_09265, partial [Rhodothermales bacterium]